MQFIKTRNVKDPVRNVEENAGIDFYIPENTDDFRRDLAAKNQRMVFSTEINNWDYTYFNVETGEIFINAHADVIIPSGIKSKFANNLALIANNKSGIATKRKLVFGASVIDASYEGEWHLHLINTSDDVQCIKCSEKIIQFIPHLISTDSVEIVDMTAEEFYKDSTSTRGEGAFGSTGLK